MADKRFNIAVTAEDAASPIFDKVKKHLGQFKKPIDDANSDFRRFSESPALKGLGETFDRIGLSAKGATSAIGSLVPGVATLTGLGTVAGIAAFEKNWVDSTAAMYRASRQIGDTFRDLQLIEGANRRVGGSAGVATQAMDAFGTVLQGAVNNRAGDAWALLGQLHIGLQRNANGAVDTTQALYDLADAYKANLKASPQTSDLIARTFGLGELGPLLRDGSAGLRKLMNETDRTGVVMGDVAGGKAMELQRSLVNLEDSARGAGNAFAVILAPGIEKAANAMSGFIQMQTEQLGRLSGGGKASGPKFSSPAMRRAAGQASIDEMGLLGAPYDAASFGAGLIDTITGSHLKSSFLDWMGGGSGQGGSAPSKRTQTPYTPAADWARQTPLIDTPSADLLAAARRSPISVPDMAPTGKVTVDIRLGGNVPAGTVSNVRQSGQVEATVATTMSGYGP